jgi:hypothetical protein
MVHTELSPAEDADRLAIRERPELSGRLVEIEQRRAFAR